VTKGGVRVNEITITITITNSSQGRRTMNQPKQLSPDGFHFNRFSVLADTTTTENPKFYPNPTPSQATPPTAQLPKLTRQLIRITTTYQTAESRESSYQNWPHKNVTPQQLSKYGFYHSPNPDYNDTIRCFACESERYSLDPQGAFTEQELLDCHKEDCIWAQMYKEIQRHSIKPTHQSERPAEANADQCNGPELQTTQPIPLSSECAISSPIRKIYRSLCLLVLQLR
jgi:hypothetical protein